MNSERVEALVLGVYMHQEHKKIPAQHFVLLRSVDGRRFTIWIGQFEAWAISFALEGKPPEHPLTHDLMLTLVQTAGAAVTEAAITDLRDETYYSTITLQVGTETHIVVARPSDAIALAIRAKCPIYVTEAVLAAADHAR